MRGVHDGSWRWQGVELDGLVRPEWPPLAHVRRGWQALSLAERDEVGRRVESVLATHQYGEHCRRDALRHFFAFLAQVETIAIEIPLRFLPVAPDKVKPLLRRQLVDEVFHSTLFARLAHQLALPEAQPGAPLPSAERLLDRIRAEPDLSVSATMLNLVAEGWIENLFKHALRWGVADAVFEAVLADESRHVHEATDYLEGLDAQRAASAVATLEEGLLQVSGEPTVGLSILDLAGEQGYADLVEDLWATHRRHLALAGLVPSKQWQSVEDTARQMAEALRAAREVPRPQELPDTPWRRAARRVWDTPRDPTMQGDFDAPVGHIKKRLLTPVMVAAIGAAWARHQRLNRIIHRDRVYQLPQVNVGVRVLVADDELATVVITEADKRSVRDISRMIVDGFKQLEAARKRRIESGAPVHDPIPDDVIAMAPPRPEAFAVALSNPGKFGMVAGAGSFSGALAPSTDISVGQRRRLPVWKGVWLPEWHVNMGCLQDHRLFDGQEAGLAMSGLREALSPKSVKRILRRPDSIPDTEEPDYDAAWMVPPALRMVPMAGFTKYMPLVVGGAGLAALAGVGGFLLWAHVAAMNDAAQQQQQQVTVIHGRLDEHGNLVPDEDPEGPILEPMLDDGRPRCRALKADGLQCGAAAREGSFCGRHGG